MKPVPPNIKFNIQNHNNYNDFKHNFHNKNIELFSSSNLNSSLSASQSVSTSSASFTSSSFNNKLLDEDKYANFNKSIELEPVSLLIPAQVHDFKQTRLNNKEDFGNLKSESIIIDDLDDIDYEQQTENRLKADHITASLTTNLNKSYSDYIINNNSNSSNTTANNNNNNKQNNNSAPVKKIAPPSLILSTTPIVTTTSSVIFAKRLHSCDFTQNHSININNKSINTSHSNNKLASFFSPIKNSFKFKSTHSDLNNKRSNSPQSSPSKEHNNFSTYLKRKILSSSSFHNKSQNSLNMLEASKKKRL